MSENPKKTFLSTLGKHLVVGSALLPAVEPKPPVEPPPPAVVPPPVVPPVTPPAPAAVVPQPVPPVAPPPVVPPVVPPAVPPAVPPVPPPPVEPVVKVVPKKSDPLPPIRADDLSPAPTVTTDEPKPITELLGYQATKAEVRYLEVIRAGAEREPDKYQAILDREIDRLKKVNEFATKWRDENPDEDLSDAPEYRKFLKANPPAIDSVEHEDLKDELRIEKARGLARQDLREEMTANARKILEIETKPVIAEAVSEVEKAVLAALPEALADGDYLRDVAKDGVGALEKVPGEGRVFAVALSRGRNVVGEFLRLRRQVTSFDPSNETHVFISRAIATVGAIFEEQGGAERIRGGKRFVQPKDFLKLTDEAKKRHWTFSDNELISTFAQMTAKGALQELEDRRKEDSAASEFRKGKVPGGKPALVAAPPPPAPIPPSSPTVTPSPAAPPSGGPGVKNPKLRRYMGIPDKA